MTKTSEDLLKAFGGLIQKRPFMGAVASSLRFGDRQRQPNQLRLLRLLDNKDELTNSDLVEALDIRPSSVSALVQKLEDLGLISRRESETDKRVQLIALTDDGKKFIETTGKLKTDLPDQIFSGLSEEEQAQLLTLIEKLSADLATRDDLSWPEGKQFDDMREWAARFHHGHHEHGPRRG
ncbi:MAG: MarR family transcriptional regulator [Lacticaseibacillus paracasei]|nr:MarR family transcriptional regulator [Lacticaseibacillus paracasei]